MTCMLSGTAGAQSVRETIRLDDGWKFAFGNASDPPCKLSVKISPPTPNIEFSVKYRLVRSLPDAEPAEDVSQQLPVRDGLSDF